MSFNTYWADTHKSVPPNAALTFVNRVVLTVLDRLDARPELRQVLQQNGCRVVETDNGRDAASSARQTHPDLLVLDMDIPLLYELVAARQIIKGAQVGQMPVVIVTHEGVLDPAPMMEVGPSRDEYVTRLSDYQELQPLLNYLLPVLPTDYASASGSAFSETAGIYSSHTSAVSAPEPRLHREQPLEKRNTNRVRFCHPISR